MNKKYLILLLLAVISTEIFGLIFGNVIKKSTTQTVILKTYGFSPDDLTIQKGTTVIFKTDAGQFFWPASDPHPVHTIYPQFDPREPIDPKKTWSFTFNKVGIWKFHDHLNPYFTGQITVLDQKQTSLNSNPCGKEGSKIQCWQAKINTTLEQNGLDKAFDVLADLYNSDSDFAVSCHGFTHTLGQKAYELFSQNKPFSLTPKVSYCGYGFYHGFMEAMYQSTGNLAGAGKFCRDIGEKLKEQTFDARGACYHGIGHGITDPHDARYQDKPQAMIDAGLKTCEKVSENQSDLFRCATGVYNATEILMSSRQYGFSIDPENPLGICNKQKIQYKSACYQNMVPPLLAVNAGDLEKSALSAEKIPEDENAVLTVNAIMVEAAHQNSPTAKNVSKYITFCRSLQNRLEQTCINSLSEGLMKYGPPQNEYKEAVAFCSSDLLSAQEKSGCYSRILSILRIWYSVDKSREICQSVDTKYQWQNCQY